MALLRYLFWPNPGNASYSSPKVTLLLLFCVLLIAGTFAIAAWRRKQSNPMTKKLSKSWPAASFWFGIAALLMIISRVEEIQFLAMRFLWVIWIAGVAFYIYVQIRQFRTRHYAVLPRERVLDPRDRYLPGKKKR